MKTVEKLKTLRAEYKSLQDILSLDLTNWDPRTKPGLEGRKNSAKIRLETLSLQLASTILENSTISIVLRDYPDTNVIVSAAKSNPAKNAVLDYLAIEKGIYRTIFGEKTGNVTFNSETLNRMNVLMAEVGQKLNAISMPTVTATSDKYGTLPTRHAMIERMESVSYEAYGYELKDLFLRNLAFDQALARLDEDSIDLVLVNTPKNFVKIAQSFAGTNVVFYSDSSPQVAKKKASRSKKVDAVASEIEIPSNETRDS